jgi:hypothetical protein
MITVANILAHLSIDERIIVIGLQPADPADPTAFSDYAAP